MRNEALWYRHFGRPEVALALERAELSATAPCAMRVRMAAAPINPSDLIPIEGAYRQRLQPPLVAGYEGVGTVVEAQGAPHLVGRRVLALRGGGTWQRYVDCDPSWAIEVPADITTPLAARAYINPLAARLMLDAWPVRDRCVLLTGAGSACANLLAQWALRSGAREVVGIHRSPQRARTLDGLGVTPLSGDRRGAVTAAVRRADLVFDAVGGGLAETVLSALRPDASFVSYGLLSGKPFAVPAGSPKPQRFHLRDRLAGAGAVVWQSWFRELWELLRHSEMPDVEWFELSDWKRALTCFRRPGRDAKPVLALS